MNPRNALVGLLLTAPLLAGCLAPSNAGCTSTGNAEFEGKTLTVLSHGAFGNFKTIQPLFENATGATLVQVKANDAGSALARAIQSKGAPVADVLYGVDNALITEALRAQIFDPYTSPRLSDLGQNISLGDFERGGQVFATPVDHGYINVNYDVGLLDSILAADLPQDLADLARPQWASKLVVENPNLSSPGLGFLLITVARFGENGTYDYLDYWRDLFDHGVLVTDGWTEAYEYYYTGGFGKSLVDTFIGGRSLVVSYTTSPAVEIYFGAAAAPGISFEPPLSVFHQVETMGILRCTHNLQLAQAFIDFSLTHAFQDTVAPELAVYPVIDGVELPAPFLHNATAPGRLPLVPFDAQTDGPKLNHWLEAWTALYHEHNA